MKFGRKKKAKSCFSFEFLESAISFFFFTFFEPQALLYAGGYAEHSNTAVYSIGFFLFWLLTSVSSLMTSYFVKPCDEVNKNLSES